MEVATIDFQFAINRTAELVVGNHPADRAFDEQFRVAFAAGLDVFALMSADVTGETHEGLLVFLLAGQPHFFGIDDHDEIAGIDVRRVDRLFLAAQQIRGLHGDSTEDLVLGVNDPPFTGDFISFSGKRFHRERKGTETMGEAVGCQQDVRGDFER